MCSAYDIAHLYTCMYTKVIIECIMLYKCSLSYLIQVRRNNIIDPLLQGNGDCFLLHVLTEEFNSFLGP